MAVSAAVSMRSSSSPRFEDGLGRAQRKGRRRPGPAPCTRTTSVRHDERRRQPSRRSTRSARPARRPHRSGRTQREREEAGPHHLARAEPVGDSSLSSSGAARRARRTRERKHRRAPQARWANAECPGESRQCGIQLGVVGDHLNTAALAANGTDAARTTSIRAGRERSRMNTVASWKRVTPERRWAYLSVSLALPTLHPHGLGFPSTNRRCRSP